ncbi:hypothetical protein KOM07_12125 [Lentilactobacillus sp. G22-6]|uniref:hypothetical protein n=1 Tax=Lentilactobacillus dabitei TaxID=2831523 RepID=UPI001C264B69|nr:hypothetical protein [Lentilactobacillus dabitei]MBU9790261.1 hypothetical protein [Lentilactobacillus dabitei]
MADLAPGMIIKYFDEEYVDDFINKGVLHFSRLGTFIDLEGNDAIADAYEGAMVTNLSLSDPGVRVTIDGHEISPVKDERSNEITVAYTPEWVRKIGIVSLTNLLLNRDFEEAGFDKEKGIYTLKLKEAVIKGLEQISENHTRIPVLIDGKRLLKRLDSGFSSGINAQLGTVNYYDETQGENIAFRDLESHPERVLFLKRKKYQYQREVRIVLFNEVPPEGKNIYLGNLSEITYKLDKDRGIQSIGVQVRKSR